MKTVRERMDIISAYERTNEGSPLQGAYATRHQENPGCVLPGSPSHEHRRDVSRLTCSPFSEPQECGSPQELGLMLIDQVRVRLA